MVRTDTQQRDAPPRPRAGRLPRLTTQISLGLLTGIDRILDMGCTSLNAMGDCIATAVVVRWEDVFDDARMTRLTMDGAA